MSTSLSSTSLRERRVGGFTLIEMMIVVAVISILAAVAIPSYQRSVQKSRRTDAKNALLDVAAKEERFLSTNNQYTATPANLGLSGTFPVPIQASGNSYYTLTVLAPAGAIPPTFLATATPTGNQASDACGSFSINQFGVQTTSLTPPGVACW